MKEFIESSWFKLLSRGAMILGTAGVGFMLGMLHDTNERLGNIEKQTAGRIILNDSWQRVASAKLNDVQADIDTMKSDITQTKVAVGRIEGMLKVDREVTVMVPHALDPPLYPVVTGN